MELMRRWAWVFGLTGFLAIVTGGGLSWAMGMEGTPRALLIGGAVCLLLYALFDRENLGQQVQSRTFMHGGTSAILTLLALVAAGALYGLAKQNDRTWDLTREGSFTLSDHSIRIVEGLEEPVLVKAFFRSDTEEQRDFRGLVERLVEHSDQLGVEWIDPLRQPRLAEQNDVASERGVVILETTDGRTQRLDTEFGEEAVIKRLVLLLAREEHKVCWALGHGEPDPDDEFSELGLGSAVIELDSLNYQVVRTVVPTGGIPRDCDVVAVVRPTEPWQPWEREALAAYVAEGGRALFLLEPDSPPDWPEELERYSLRLRPDFVLDLNPENQLMGVNDPSFLVLHGRNVLSHPITANLAAAVLLPITRSVEPLDGVDGLRAKGVLVTSIDSWGETDPQGEPRPDQGTELVSEVPVMATVEVDDPSVIEVAAHGPIPEGADPNDPTVGLGRAVPEDLQPEAGARIVVVGDTDFATNGGLTLGNNRDLFLNSIAWLVEEEAQIGERPDTGETVALDELAASLLCLISMIFVPGGVGLIGLFTWWRRRRL